MALGSPQWMYKSGEAYTIDQSLKLDRTRATYLTRTPAANGNRRTWTMSYWIKYCSLADHHTHFGGSLAGSESIGLKVQFDGNTRQLMVVDFRAGYNIDWIVKSDPGFRDPSAWYHIVIAIDTTQATAANRVRLYANGVESSKTSYTPTYPSQNFETKFNQNNPQIIGAQFDNLVAGSHFDGYMGEINFIDGQALTPADFGETGDYGEWKPIEYSGSYGTNGYYLPMKQDYAVEGFSTVTWKGNGATSHYIGGAGFKPSLTWLKPRSVGDHNLLYDRVRGFRHQIKANSTNAEDITNKVLPATDGILLTTTDQNQNSSSHTYVAWNWDMGADTPTGFGAVAYKGGGARHQVDGFGFAPSLVWIKCREGTESHSINDIVRGTQKRLLADATNAEDAGGITKFNPDGFTTSTGYGSDGDGTGNDFIAWGWDMGGTTVTNTSGSINTQVRANPTYGQSIVSYSGNGTNNSTIGHGLSSAPEMVIVKSRDGTNNDNWGVGHTSIGWTKALRLNLTDAEDTNSNFWNNTAPSSTLVTLGNGSQHNSNTEDYIAYAFHSVSGYSKFGSYTGNGSTTGPTVTLGFRPAFLIVKRTDGAGDWAILDSTRDPLNNVQKMLRAQGTDAESDVNNSFTTEFTDTGFQCKANNGYFNASGGTYIYMAFAGGMDSISDYNTTGDIDARVKANPTYGQSIVQYAGASNAVDDDADNSGNYWDIPHGLSSKPEMIIVRNRGGGAWYVGHKDLATNPFANHKYQQLQTDRATDTGTAILWGGTEPTSSVFTVGGWDVVNRTGNNYIAYCFHSVTGYSKFGSYSGTAGTHTVTTGFEPAFIMIKRTNSAGEHWYMYDNTRFPNSQQNTVTANNDSAEGGNSSMLINYLSTGFQIVGTNAGINGNGDTYIYMAFADNREYAYWLDQSGNNNDWTSNNLTESDISVDSPTNNFATMNPLDIHQAGKTTLSEGNLKLTATSGTHNISLATFSVSSGKWYWEYKVDNSSVNNQDFGFVINKSGSDFAADSEVGSSGNNGYAYSPETDKIKSNGTASSAFGSGVGVGSIIGIALDMDNGKVWWSVNGTFVSSGNPATGSNAQYSSISGNATPAIRISNTYINDPVVNFGQESSFAGNKTAQGNQDGNDIGDFYYTPPTGFLALCTKNLPNVAVVPSEHFNTVLYTGNNTSSLAVTGVGFQPDFVWIKNRSIARNHGTYDAIRGATKDLIPNDTSAEITRSTGLTSFDSNGFSLGSHNNVNEHTADFVAWNWKAPTSSNLTAAGERSMATTSKLNVDAKFEIITYTGNGTAGAKIGHSLGVVPELLIIRRRNADNTWTVYCPPAVDQSKKIHLENTDVIVSNSTTLNNTAPTSTAITLGNDNRSNGNGDTYVIYAFASVNGYSSFGSFNGNGNADGAFVHTGFKPAFVMIRNTTRQGEGFVLFNNKSDPANVVGTYLTAYGSTAEQGTAGTTSSRSMDFVSNGFKLRGNSTEINENTPMIYIAFAETPFKYSNAR